MEAFFLAALQMSSGIGSVQLARLVSFFGTAERAWQADAGNICNGGCLNQHVAEVLCSFIRKNRDLPKQLQETCGKAGISICTITENQYPVLLKQIFNPPQVLFYRGQLQSELCRIAVVGSRHFSAYGQSVAENLSGELASCGVTVVSGAARGIDTAAHRGALREGRTVAVLGCGVDIAYPAENRGLLAQIAEQGVVLSEYPPGTRPMPGFFPARNRIISGLAKGTLVVEAAEKSGSLITAELALSEGRDVFAVPGSIYSDTSKGCHHLIQQGAKLVTMAEDILEEYGWVPGKEESPCKSGQHVLSPEETAVYQVLSFEKPLSIDEIIYKLQGSNTANIAFILLQMELKGIVREDVSHAYVRTVKEGIL